MKHYLLKIILLILLLNYSLNAQRKISPTTFFTISGKVISEQIITVKKLDSFPKKDIKDLIIFNHKGEIKDTIKNIRGVLFKEVFSKTTFTNQKPKNLNEFYFVCSASDGYKVVFSWNEIFNSEVGNNLYFITEMDGKSLEDLEQRIILLSSSDIQNGRRYIKGLEKIEVKQVE